MTEEILQAAILKLKSKAMEQYGLLKQAYHSPADEGTVDKICRHALHLVEFEGAMLTLQQYSGAIMQSPSPPQQAAPQQEEGVLAAEPEEEEAEDDEDPEGYQIDGPIRGEELMKRSATYRRSAKSPKTTKGKKSESKAKKKSE